MSDTPEQPTQPAPTIPEGYLCYRCSYPLTGLVCDGECPECSTRYSFALAFTGKPHPGQAKLALRIAFPALVLVGAFGVVLMIILIGMVGGGGRSNIRELGNICSCTSVVMAAVNLFYVPIVSSAMTNEYVPPHARKGWGSNMLYLGRWVYAGWLLGIAAIAAPLVIMVIGILIMIAGIL